MIDAQIRRKLNTNKRKYIEIENQIYKLGFKNI